MNFKVLPSPTALKQLCKAIAALDAIICREWEYRYYSYQNEWDAHNKEEFFEMRNGSGDQFQILFSEHGTIINGFAHESVMARWEQIEVPSMSFKDQINLLFGQKKTETVQRIWPGVVDAVPVHFHDFIFGEPVKSLGTTFCIWRTNQDTQWQQGNITFPDDKYSDGSSDLLYILDGNPETYYNWAKEYYDDENENLPFDLSAIKSVYNGEDLTLDMVQRLNPKIESMDELEEDLEEIF